MREIPEMNNWKKVFAIIWTGQLFSILSSNVVGFAVILWLSVETKSAEVLAMGTLALLLPQSLLGLISGVFVDRWSRKLTMIFSDLFIAVCTLMIAAIFFWGTVEIRYIYLLLVLRSAGSAFHTPAMQASVPLLAPAEQLTRIAGINQMIFSICNIAGPLLGAFLIGFLDISYILLIDVAGALIACCSLLLVSIPNPERKEKTKLNIWNDLCEAVNGVRAIRGLVCLFSVSVLATFVIMPASVLFPLMTLIHFSGSTIQMGIIEVVWGSGMLLGGGIIGIWSWKRNQVLLINAMYLLLGFSFLFSGLLPSEGYVLFAVFSFLGGIAGSIYYASFVAIIQRRVAPELLGRVFSAYSSVSLLPSMIGLLATGFIADTIGIDTTFIISGLVICLLGVTSYFLPPMLSLGKNV
ncbi:MFS transporter DHA3 family macrolide efflux protein [termite gut metagenome]|uniref:MFS transporter DHA3 family macrolide efflux protein n=1 Tax=termite gut metagenome TaxID=433724 RepID=A0A5J4RE43_9ZZZZ